MHFHQALLITAIAVALTACAVVTSPKESALPVNGGQTLCFGRDRCTVGRHRTAGDGRIVVDVRIGHRLDAAEDADRCDRREYWLVTSSTPRLIAADCEEQWGADNPGPADTSVSGNKMTVRYIEYGANDTC
jgi:hypothetical protein